MGAITLPVSLDVACNADAGGPCASCVDPWLTSPFTSITVSLWAFNGVTDGTAGPWDFTVGLQDSADGITWTTRTSVKITKGVNTSSPVTLSISSNVNKYTRLGAVADSASSTFSINLSGNATFNF